MAAQLGGLRIGASVDIQRTDGEASPWADVFIEPNPKVMRASARLAAEKNKKRKRLTRFLSDAHFVYTTGEWSRQVRGVSLLY